MKTTLLFSLLLLAQWTMGQVEIKSQNGLTLQDSALMEKVPDWVKPVLEKSELAKKHKILSKNNPFYFEADFTGDKTIDIAFVVENVQDHSQGIMMINADKNLVYVIGCGNPTELGANLFFIENWFIYREKSIRGTDKKIQAITTPGIIVRGKRDKNMVIYWSKSKYKTIASDE